MLPAAAPPAWGTLALEVGLLEAPVEPAGEDPLVLALGPLD